MTADRPPNRQLAAVMDEAGFSNGGLAKRIRILATQDGQHVSADHVSVRRWLDGTVPRERTCRYIALALGRRLGRSLTLAELGFSIATDETPDLDREGNTYPGDARQSIDTLDHLAAADLDGSPDVERLLWTPNTTPGTITSYLFGSSGELTESHERSAVEEAAAIRDTAAHLMSLDFAHGGGHVRKLLLFYFNAEVLPVLRSALPDRRRQDVFSAAAEVIQLLGWSAYDAGRHGAAQRYFVRALRLAQEAGDHMMGGRLLSNLSHQANYLGHFTDALHLARAAQSATAGRASATVTAMLLAMEARALASIGNAGGCARTLSKAEHHLGRQDLDADPPWISYFDAEELAGEAAHCFRDLGDPAQTSTFARAAVGLTNTPPRTRAFIGMVEAAGVLRAGILDQAVDLALGAVRAAGAIQSSRYLRYLTDFHQALAAGHAGDARVRAFADAVLRYYPNAQLPGGAG